MEKPFPPLDQVGTTAPDAVARTLVALGDGAGGPPLGNTGGKFQKTDYSITDPETGEVFLMCPTPGFEGFYGLKPVCPEGVHPYAAITDYLNSSFKFDPEEEPLPELIHELYGVLGEKFVPAVDRNTRLHHYKRSLQLGESSALLGMDGPGKTFMLSLSGEACSLIKDWQKIVNYFRDYRGAKITRWDGAVDDFSGVHSIDWAVQQYEAGQFNTGGNKPSCRNHGNWTDPDGTGRSFEVGKRQNGKRVQIYEKGQQLGALWHPWVRWEVELHNKSREIPWEVLLMPAPYVVGSYPNVLDWVQDEMIRIKTIQKQTKISYDNLVHHASNSYGALINVMLDVEGNAEAVIKKLLRDGIPKRLNHPLTNKPSTLIQGETNEP